MPKNSSESSSFLLRARVEFGMCFTRLSQNPRITEPWSAAAGSLNFNVKQ